MTCCRLHSIAYDHIDCICIQYLCYTFCYVHHQDLADCKPVWHDLHSGIFGCCRLQLYSKPIMLWCSLSLACHPVVTLCSTTLCFMLMCCIAMLALCFGLQSMAWCCSTLGFARLPELQGMQVYWHVERVWMFQGPGNSGCKLFQ